MFEQFPCALAPAQEKTLRSALGLGFWGFLSRPLTGATCLLGTLGALAVFAGFCLVGSLWTDHGVVVLIVAIISGQGAFRSRVARERGALIKKLYGHIMSMDGAEASAQPENTGPS